jgi:chaperonin cofactor prefoldin
MSTLSSALNALKQVVLLQDRVERLEKRLDTMNDDVDGLTDMSHDLDKRLYALERIIDIGAQQARQKRIEP